MQAAAVADLQVRTGKVLAGEIISSEIRKGGEGGEGGGWKDVVQGVSVPSRRCSSRNFLVRNVLSFTQKVHRVFSIHEIIVLVARIDR